MAHFRSKLQIPVVILTQNISFFRVWGSRKKKPIESVSSNGCKRPSAAPVELCTGAPSKCLEKICKDPVKPKRRFFMFRRKQSKKSDQPEKAQKTERELNCKERSSGVDSGKCVSDPGASPCRAKDPRLEDPRYQATAGDVLLYTELPKCNKRPSLEPQPKSPPLFKPPKAVLCKMMVEASEKRSRVTLDVLCNGSCEGKAMKRMIYKIPYEEMRPVGKRRKAFNCQDGIGPEDVLKPIATDSNLFLEKSRGISLNVKRECETDNGKDGQKVVEKKLVPKPQKRSRIEQLKILVQEKVPCDGKYPQCQSNRQ